MSLLDGRHDKPYPNIEGDLKFEHKLLSYPGYTYKWYCENLHLACLVPELDEHVLNTCTYAVLYCTNYVRYELVVFLNKINILLTKQIDDLVSNINYVVYIKYSIKFSDIGNIETTYI